MKKYQFTLTENYVSDWGYIEAIRELLQNAYDYGNESIKILDDSVVISNKDDILNIKSLLLGYGTKTNDRDQIGGFGEGFLLALLVLTRLNFKVTIINGPEVWIPGFEHSEEFDESLLIVRVYKNEANDYKDFDVSVEGFSNEQINEIKRVFLGLNGPYTHIATSYGEILLDPDQKGRMYVDGLPITFDNNFSYGYNFKAKYVKLDRDRKEINTYELKRITSMALTTMQAYDFKLIDDLIIRGGDDANYIVNNNISLNDDFVYGYSDYLKDKYKVSDYDIVINKTEHDVIDELFRRGESVITVDRKVQADVINNTNIYSSSKLEEVRSTIKNRTNIEEAWDNYNYSEYKSLLEWYQAIIKDDPSDEILAERFRSGKEDFFNILENLEPLKFHYIKDQIDKS